MLTWPDNKNPSVKLVIAVTWGRWLIVLQEILPPNYTPGGTNSCQYKSEGYCQAQVQVPNPLSHQAPNPDSKVRPSLKNPKPEFFGLG